MAEFRENNPLTALGYNVAGSLPTALIPGLGMARGAQGIKQLAGAGAKLGAVRGFSLALGRLRTSSAGTGPRTLPRAVLLAPPLAGFWVALVASPTS